MSVPHRPMRRQPIGASPLPPSATRHLRFSLALNSQSSNHEGSYGYAARRTRQTLRTVRGERHDHGVLWWRWVSKDTYDDVRGLWAVVAMCSPPRGGFSLTSFSWYASRVR